MIQLCCKVVPINNSNLPSYSSKCLEGNRKTFSKSMIILPILQRFQSTHPSTDVINALCFQQLYLQNDCIDLHMRYTVGIGILARSQTPPEDAMYASLTYVCSAYSDRVRACEELCLQSPLEYRQRWRWRDERRHTVPDTCRRYWKRTITNRPALRSRNDKRRRVWWSKSPSRICVGHTSEHDRQVRWCSIMLSAKASTARRYTNSSELVTKWGRGVTELHDRTSEPSRSVARRRVVRTESIKQHVGQTGKSRSSVIQTRQNHRNDEQLENWFGHRPVNAANSSKNGETIRYRFSDVRLHALYAPLPHAKHNTEHIKFQF